MEIEKAIGKIKASIKSNSVEKRRHFADMIKHRELDETEINTALENNEILGIVYQGEDVYKLTMRLRKDKDLNIVVGVSEEKKDIRYVSIFPSETTRRVKHGKR